MPEKVKIKENVTTIKNVRDFRGLKRLKEDDLPRLCQDIRDLIVDVTLKNGGHLGGSLGSVELCVSLLRVFDPDRDKIIFDVGHQAYAYKILTDRLEKFHTLRKKGGISGFPRRNESPYDFFDVGHSSTSISAALGFAKARDLAGQKHDVVAIIGDGALLNGLAFEALNNVRTTDSKVVIVVNDNGMSISPRVGGLAEHLAKLSVNNNYKRLKQFIKNQCHLFNNGKNVEELLDNIKTKMKSLLLPTNVFEAMEINYWGPFDGHNLQELQEIFELSKNYPKSLIIHVITQKGKGCYEAEAAPSFFHGIGGGTSLAPKAVSDKEPVIDWSQAVADILVELAGKDHRVLAGTAAMIDGTKLAGFQKKFPRRFFDVGIAEGHMMTYAAGLAAGGMRPVVCIYSTFLQRAMDQLTHDICLQHLPVLICVDRAGFSGEDGETHQGLLDLSWCRSIPHLVMAAPRDQVDLAYMLTGWLQRKDPMLIRYPKGAAPLALKRTPNSDASPWGKAEVLEEGENVCLIGLGSTVPLCLAVRSLCEEKSLTLPSIVDLRFISPLDLKMVDCLARRHKHIIVVEEGYQTGGVGEGIASYVNSQEIDCHIIYVAAPETYVAHASRNEQLIEYHFDPTYLVSLVEEYNGADFKKA